MKKMLKNLMLLLAVLPLLTVSCSIFDEDNQEPGSGKGRVSVYVTDAPFPADLVEKVLVTVEKVALRYEKGKCPVPEGEDPEEFECEEGFLLVMEEPEIIDILQLQNGLTKLLADAEIPVGKYDMIRLYIEDAEIIVDSEKKYDLKVPGGSTDGLKIFLHDPIEVTEEGMAEILVDFDLSRSFNAIGNPKNKNGIKGFIFKPVIRAVDVTKTGSIKGKVQDADKKAVEGALITLLKGDEAITTALTDKNGGFKIIGIPPGNYRLTIEKEGYTTKSQDVNVSSKKETYVLSGL
jgi:hypothetical protein